MDKSKCWMWIPHSQTASEMIQRVAFSFGYKWYGGETHPMFINDKSPLMFDTVAKDVTIGGLDCVHLATSLSEALELFKNPPKPKTKEIPHAVLHSDGSITLGGGMLSGEAFDLLVKARNEYVGRVK